MSQEKEMQNTPARPKQAKRRSGRFLLLFVVPVLLVVGSVVVYLNGGRYVETDNAYVKADKTSITAEVSGRILSVAVAENQRVEEGDLLLKIDPRSYEIAVEQAKANLNNVETDLETIKAQYQSQLAKIDVAKSQLEYLKKEQARQLNLLKKKYISQAEYDAAKQSTDVQRLEIEQEQRNLTQIAQSLGGNVEAPVQLHPRYQAALAMLDKAENDLLHVNVYAPSAGVVTKVVEKGQYIAPGSLAMMLVSEKDLWIEANLTESDMTYVQAGQKVEISVDYAPDTTWEGEVESLSPATGAEFSVIPAQNATGNWVKISQRLPVRIRIDAQDNAPQLRAGLSAEVSIDTQHQRHLAL